MKHVFIFVGCITSFLLEIFYPSDRSEKHEVLPKKSVQMNDEYIALNHHNLDTYLLKNEYNNRLNAMKLFEKNALKEVRNDSIK